MNLRIATRAAVVIATILMVLGGCAMQEDVAVVNNRLMALKRKVDTQDREAEADRDLLRSDIKQCRKETQELAEAHSAKHAEFNALMQDLREDMQELSGSWEESSHKAQESLDGQAEWQAKQKELLNGLQREAQGNLERIVRLEQYLGLEPSEKLVSSGQEGAESNQEEAGGEEKTPEALYALAKKRFDEGDYEEARQLFQAYLQQYPKSDNADSAQFWIGEIYYREKWYEKAILEYQRVIEDHPNGNKVPSALLKQGFGFSNLGDVDNARLILKELVHKYPNSNEAKIAEKKLNTLQ